MRSLYQLRSLASFIDGVREEIIMISLTLAWICNFRRLYHKWGWLFHVSQTNLCGMSTCPNSEVINEMFFNVCFYVFFCFNAFYFKCLFVFCCQYSYFFLLLLFFFFFCFSNFFILKLYCYNFYNLNVMAFFLLLLIYCDSFSSTFPSRSQQET